MGLVPGQCGSSTARRALACQGCGTERQHPRAQAVQKDFAECYLKQLGARPTKQNLDMMRKNMNCKEGRVIARLRGQGYAHDEVHITAPPVKHAVRTGISLMPAKGMIRMAVTNEMLTDKEINDDRELAMLEGSQVRRVPTSDTDILGSTPAFMYEAE